MSLIKPLAKTETPSLKEDFELFENILGFIPNSILTMQRKPAIVEGFSALTKAVMDPNGEVDPGFKRLLAHFVSAAAGCQYCQAHTLLAADIAGISDQKLAELWSYKESSLYSDAERVALDFALATGSVPNTVDEELQQQMRQYWSENQIVEILGAISLYGFLNRWNDAMATEIEPGAIAMAEKYLEKDRWDGGKHRT
ncbi:MAG: carboxymuconolactone decarboxylase family protein [bacterium]